MGLIGGKLRTFAWVAALLASSPAAVFAQSQALPAKYDRLGDSSPLPHWCEDLGMAECRATPGAPAAGRERVDRFLSRFMDIDPRRFLPSELAVAARRCQSARLAAEDSSLAESLRTRSREFLASDCGSHGPLSGENATLDLIPEELVEGASLPRSGARVVVDCVGRHLQIRGDLSLDDTAALLRRTLRESYKISLVDTLRDLLPRTDIGGPTLLQQRQRPTICQVGNARRSHDVRFAGEFMKEYGFLACMREEKSFGLWRPRYRALSSHRAALKPHD